MLWYMGYIPELEGFDRLASDFQEQFAEFSEEEKLAAWGAVSEFAKGISDPKVLGKVAPKINATAKGAFKTSPSQVPADKASTIKNALGSKFSRVGQLKGPVISNVQGQAENTVARSNAPVADKTAEELTPDDLEIFADTLAKSAGGPDDGVGIYGRAVADALSEAIPAAARVANQRNNIDPNTGLSVDAEIEEQQKIAAPIGDRGSFNNRRDNRGNGYGNRGGYNNRDNRGGSRGGYNNREKEQSFSDKYPKLSGALMLGGAGLVGGGITGAVMKHRADKAMNKAISSHFGDTIDYFGDSASRIFDAARGVKADKDEKFRNLATKYKMQPENAKHVRKMYEEYMHNVGLVRKMGPDLAGWRKDELAMGLASDLTRMKVGGKIPTELLEEMHDHMLKTVLNAPTHHSDWATKKTKDWHKYNY